MRGAAQVKSGKRRVRLMRVGIKDFTLDHSLRMKLRMMVLSWQTFQKHLAEGRPPYTHFKKSVKNVQPKCSIEGRRSSKGFLNNFEINAILLRGWRRGSSQNLMMSIKDRKSEPILPSLLVEFPSELRRKTSYSGPLIPPPPIPKLRSYLHLLGNWDLLAQKLGERQGLVALKITEGRTDWLSSDPNSPNNSYIIS